MREHEVPTHVQAEDRVLLWFTFPQVVAMTAVCALSYGAYRYAPVGPNEVRMGIAVLFGLLGIAVVVGKVGGRRLPLVAADLLKYRLGARVYAGLVSQLVRPEPPAPVHPAKGSPGPLSLMAKRAKKTMRRLRRRRKSGAKRGRRMPFRPHRWFGKRRRTEMDRDNINDNGSGSPKARSRKKLPKHFMAVVAAVSLAAVTVVPQSALADGHEPWRDEIDFEVEEPVEGRRIFVESFTVSGDRAAVTLRAATDLDIRVRAFGGSEGATLRFWGSASLAEGEAIDYSLPLHGHMPSFTVSWEDTLGQAGALTVESEKIPYPLPVVEGELCDLSMISLGWTPGTVSGVIESVCEVIVEEPVELQTVAGHESVTETALMEAGVTAIAGTVNAATGASRSSVTFIPDGETSFRLAVPTGEAIHAVSVDVSIEASLTIPIPPLTTLTHYPERAEKRTETVSLWRPGASDSDSDSETITVTHDDGTTTDHTVSAHAYAHVPGTTIQKQVTLTIVHPEHVKAETTDRAPITKTRGESLSLASAVGSDDPFQTLTLPQPEPEDPPAEQSPGGDLTEWFRRLGWEWPW